MTTLDEAHEGGLEQATPGPNPATETPRILVPVEEGKLGRIAISVARTLSRIMGGEIHVLGVSEEKLTQRELLQRLGLHPEMVSGAVIELVPGPMNKALSAAAEGPFCSMIVIAERRRHSDGECILYPDLKLMLSDTKCPALIVPVDEEAAVTRTGRAMQRVLLPLDGSPETAEAIQPAVDLAYAAGADIDVIHVIRPDELGPQSPGTLSVPRYLDHPEHDWPAWSREFLARFVKCITECPIQPKSRVFVRTGDLVEEVLKFAEEETPSVIALSWRGSLEEGRSGETVKRVLCLAKSPILITKANVPPPTVWREKSLRNQAH